MGELSDKAVEMLSRNKYVDYVSTAQIKYSEEFQELFIKKYTEGVSPTKIFADAGLDPKVLGGKRIERATARWKEKYLTSEERAKFITYELNILSDEAVEKIEQNPNVISVNNTRIIYTESFKKEFIRRNKQGEKPMKIFASVGLGADLLGKKRIQKAAERWRRKYKIYD